MGERDQAEFMEVAAYRPIENRPVVLISYKLVSPKRKSRPARSGFDAGIQRESPSP